FLSKLEPSCSGRRRLQPRGPASRQPPGSGQSRSTSWVTVRSSALPVKNDHVAVQALVDFDLARRRGRLSRSLGALDAELLFHKLIEGGAGRGRERHLGAGLLLGPERELDAALLAGEEQEGDLLRRQG